MFGQTSGLFWAKDPLNHTRNGSLISQDFDFIHLCLRDYDLKSKLHWELYMIQTSYQDPVQKKEKIGLFRFGLVFLTWRTGGGSGDKFKQEATTQCSTQKLPYQKV